MWLQITLDDVIIVLWFPAWVEAMWDVEFTESKPLDDSIKEELTATGDKAFRNLYQCLLAHADDQQQSPGRDQASQVKQKTKSFW